MAELRLDYNFAMEKFVDGGMGEDAFADYQEKARLGLSRLIDLGRKGDIGFMSLPQQDTAPYKELVNKVKGKFNDLIIVGIGGSSLGIEALINGLLPYGYNGQSFPERGYHPRVWVADNVDPSKINAIMKECEPEDTYLCVITKSGSTVETIANFSILYGWLKESVGNVRKHMCVITDPEKGPLREFAAEQEVTAFDVPENVGGRFSVLSAVGLVPAALLGIDIDRILKGASTVTASDYKMVLAAAAIYMHAMDNGRNINVLMPYSSRLESFADWFCQLWGESLGKTFTAEGEKRFFGTTPVPAVGAIDQHSQLQLYKDGPHDKIITFIEIESHDFDKTIPADYHAPFSYLNGKTLNELINTELRATEAALRNTGRPNIKITTGLIDEASVGALFMLFQYIVPVIGLANGINPFDQPGVEEGKQYAYGLLERDGFANMKKKFEELYDKSDDYIV